MKDADDFLSLHTGKMSERFVSVAHVTYRICGSMLTKFPDEHDLQRLREFLVMQMTWIKHELLNSTNPQTWLKLVELTTTRVLVFNGRHGAEVADLKVTDFVKASCEADPVISVKLTYVERQLLGRSPYMFDVFTPFF